MLRSLIIRSSFAYFATALVGGLLLYFPLSRTKNLGLLDLLFTSVSALSSTGLATFDIGSTFTFFGKCIILILIQLGGFFYLVFSSYLILILNTKKECSFKNVFRESLVYTLFIEAIGVFILYLLFRKENVDFPFFNALFHTISAFCTAGFSLFPTNLERFRDNVAINVLISLQSLFGALGFFYMGGLLKRRRKLEDFYKSITFIVILGSTILFFLVVKIKDSTTFKKLIISFFQTITAITTAGFNTINLKELEFPALVILIFLMLYGLLITGSCFHIKRLGKKNILKIQYAELQAIAFILFTYLVMLLIITLFLSYVEGGDLMPLFFEVVSALCTVGLSLGITPELSSMGKWIILISMFIGRNGILVLSFLYATSFLKREQTVQ